MSRKYASSAQAACGNPKTILGITSASTVRPGIVFASFGASGTPADNALQFLLQRYTDPGTNTAVTPRALDPADPAALASAGSAHTVEPTYTSGAVLLRVPLNQRATLLWYANDRNELRMPATASNGIGVSATHASFTGNVDICLHHDE